MVSAYKFLPLKKNTHENPLPYSFYVGRLQPFPVFPNLANCYMGYTAAFRGPRPVLAMIKEERSWRLAMPMSQ